MGVYTEIPVTVADIDALPEDGNRYEVIEGEFNHRLHPGSRTSGRLATFISH
jgi:hypothetical protein